MSHLPQHEQQHLFSQFMNNMDYPSLKDLLSRPNLVDVTGPSNHALVTACTYGHRDIVELLLAHPNVDVNKPDNHGWTPFAWAFHYGKEGAVEALLSDPRTDVNKVKLSIHSLF